MHYNVSQLAAAPAGTPRRDKIVEQVPGWRCVAAANTGLTECCLIVPTFCRPAQIDELFKALVDIETARPGSVPAEIAIVDGSPDDSIESIAARFASKRLPFDLVYVRSRAGLTRQRNVGIDATTAPHVFFLDDDAIPAADYFREILAVYVNDGRRAIGAVGGCVTNEWNIGMSWRWRVRLALGIVPRAKPMQYLHCGTSVPRGLQEFYSGTRSVDLLSGCAFSFRRDVLDRQRFSSFFDGYSQGEDMEISLRVKRQWEVVCCGDAKVVHHEVKIARTPSYSKGHMETRNRLHIWKLYSSQVAGFGDRIRLTADLLFLFFLDMGAFLRRPWVPAPLFHLAGMLGGVLRPVAPAKVPDPDGHQYRYQVAWRPCPLSSYHQT